MEIEHYQFNRASEKRDLKILIDRISLLAVYRLLEYLHDSSSESKSFDWPSFGLDLYFAISSSMLISFSAWNLKNISMRKVRKFKSGRSYIEFIDFSLVISSFFLFFLLHNCVLVVRLVSARVKLRIVFIRSIVLEFNFGKLKFVSKEIICNQKEVRENIRQMPRLSSEFPSRQSKID